MSSSSHTFNRHQRTGAVYGVQPTRWCGSIVSRIVSSVSLSLFVLKISALMLQNFLEGLALANALPKTVHLQLGAKYYGVHLGPTKIPQEETDPRVMLEPNFYYSQEDFLIEFTKKHGINWVTTRPSCIPGAVPDAAMNLCLPLAIYATVQRHLGKPLEYPVDLVSWETQQSLSSGQLNGYFTEWAVLTDATQNQSLNTTDDFAFIWGSFWPKLAAKFKMDWTRPETDPASLTEVVTPYNPPPRGFGPPGTIRYKFTLVDWAKQPEVQIAWKEISDLHGLKYKELCDTDRVFGFTDAAMQWPYPIHYSYVSFADFTATGADL